MTIKEMQEIAHEMAVQHGFWERVPEVGTNIALIHSELSEALEEVRDGNDTLYYRNIKDGDLSKVTPPATDVAVWKPEGVASELADAVIRIADLCGAMGINLESAIKIKMAFNQTRPYKHGRRF